MITPAFPRSFLIAFATAIGSEILAAKAHANFAIRLGVKPSFILQSVLFFGTDFDSIEEGSVAAETAGHANMQWLREGGTCEALPLFRWGFWSVTVLGAVVLLL